MCSKKLLFIVILSSLNFIYCEDLFKEAKLKVAIEDQRVVEESIAKYEHPQHIKQLGLPGAETLTDKKKNNLKNQFTGDPENYNLRTRRITPTISNNARCEEGIIKEDVLVVKGVFCVHFEREAEGFYIQPNGYTIHDTSDPLFLIDLSTAIPNERPRVSSSLLQSLIGGNTIG